MLLMLCWSRRSTARETAKRVWSWNWCSPYVSVTFLFVYVSLCGCHCFFGSRTPFACRLREAMPIYMNSKHFISSTTRRTRFLTHHGQSECEPKQNWIPLLPVAAWTSVYVCARTRRGKHKFASDHRFARHRRLSCFLLRTERMSLP